MGPRGLLCQPLGDPGRRRRGDAAHHRDRGPESAMAGGGVADIRRAEALEDANAALDRAAGRANGIAAITPERVIREGDPTEQMLDVIENDVDIALLVLAANPGPEGPGPIISMMANTVGSFPIPVTIISGDLSDEDIDGLS